MSDLSKAIKAEAREAGLAAKALTGNAARREREKARQLRELARKVRVA